MTPHSSDKLQITKIVEGDIMCLRLVGTIDEDFGGVALGEQARGTLVLDLGQVRRISSFGIREWVDFLRAAEPHVHAIYFIECSPKVLDQFNMVANFAGSGKILSFYAPFRCDYCDDDRRHLVQVAESYELIRAKSLPDEPCAGCGNAEYFDDDPESFFTYLLSTEPATPDAAVANFLADKLDYRVSDAARRLRVDKEVTREGTFLRLAGDLDLNFPAFKLAEGLEGDVVIDLRGVGRVDDEGARLWNHFVMSVDSDAATLYLRDCQPGFVERAFTPGGLAGKVEVISFFMPFKCPGCGTTAAQRVDTAEHFNVLKFATSPELQCSDCQTTAPSIASDEFLACLGNLIPPTASAALRAFARSAHERLLRPPVPSAAPAVAPPVATASPAGRTVGLSFLAAVLGTLLVLGGAGAWIYTQVLSDQKPRPARYDEGARGQPTAPAPKWMAGLRSRLEKARNRPAALDAAYVEHAGAQRHFMGYSYTTPRRSESETRARQAAESALVEHLARSVKDPVWQRAVVAEYGKHRARILAGLRDAIRRQDSLETRKWRQQLWERREAVAQALGATAIAYQTPKVQTHVEKVVVRAGTRWRYWVRLSVSARWIAALVRQYTHVVDARSQGLKLVDFFPGLAWRYPKRRRAAVVLSADKQAGPWRHAPLNVGHLVVTCAEIPIRNAARFQQVVERRVAALVDRGGSVGCTTQRGDDIRQLVYKVAKVAGPRPRAIHRGSRVSPRPSATTPFNIWFDPSQ